MQEVVVTLDDDVTFFADRDGRDLARTDQLIDFGATDAVIPAKWPDWSRDLHVHLRPMTDEGTPYITMLWVPHVRMLSRIICVPLIGLDGPRRANNISNAASVG